MSDFSERDGRELAVTMLHDMSIDDSGPMSIEAKYRDGAPQINVVLR